MFTFFLMQIMMVLLFIPNWLSNFLNSLFLLWGFSPVIKIIHLLWHCNSWKDSILPDFFKMLSRSHKGFGKNRELQSEELCAHSPLVPDQHHNNLSDSFSFRIIWTKKNNFHLSNSIWQKHCFNKWTSLPTNDLINMFPMNK